MPTFDMVVVGSGGGPDETNLSAYLLKPYEAAWEDGILALEAGSGQGAIKQLLRQNPHLFDSPPQTISRKYSASEIYSFIRCFLVTHAHLDHVNSLVLTAGSMGGPRRRIYASKKTLKNLETIFSNRIWPNLASWNEEDENYKLLYSSLFADNEYKSVHPEVSVRTLPLNHGHYETGVYDSTAFFIRHDLHQSEFLFFGDVEPDKVTAKPQTINVWRAAAPKIPHHLSTIFIECSWPSGRPDDALYGHLNPEHLTGELMALATEVVKFKREQARTSVRPVRKKRKKAPISPIDLQGALDGVRVFVMHCKDGETGDSERPMCDVIVDQVRELVRAQGLGASILAAEQGMRIEI